MFFEEFSFCLFNNANYKIKKCYFLKASWFRNNLLGLDYFGRFYLLLIEIAKWSFLEIDIFMSIRLLKLRAVFYVIL